MESALSASEYFAYEYWLNFYSHVYDYNHPIAQATLRACGCAWCLDKVKGNEEHLVVTPTPGEG